MSEPRADFKLRAGKYQGQTYEWVCKNNPSYVRWIKENRPNMLKEKVTKVTNVKEDKKPFGKLPFNTNFDNEGPAPNSMIYIERMAKETGEDEYNF